MSRLLMIFQACGAKLVVEQIAASEPIAEIVFNTLPRSLHGPTGTRMLRAGPLIRFAS